MNWTCRDGNASCFTPAVLTWKTLWRIWVQFPLVEWPETTSHQERQENSLRQIKSCTIRCTWFVHEFLFLVDFSYIFIAGNWKWHGNFSNKKKWKRERGHISTRKLVAWTNRYLKLKQKWRQRGRTRKLVAWSARMATGIQGRIDGWKNTETLAVLLMNYLWSREQKWYRVNIAFFTHFPKDRNCDICLMRKITRASCRRRTGTVVPRAEHFGDLITADHKVLSEGCESQHNHRCAVVVQDLATHWIQRSLQRFLEPTRKPKVIYTDNSMEFGKACEEWTWNYWTSTPHRSETHGIAERAVRSIKEGTYAVLLHSGLDEKWLADFMEC